MPEYFCDVCRDDHARCQANPDDRPGAPHPDDPHTQAAEAIAQHSTIGASVLEHLAQLTPEEREALSLAILEDGLELERPPTIQVGGSVTVGPVETFAAVAGAPTLGEAHILAPGQAFGNRPWVALAAPTDAEIRDAVVRAKFMDAKIGVIATTPRLRRGVDLALSVLADTGGVIADVLEARARSYDHPNQIVLEQDREAFAARDAKHQARMQKLHPELRELNRTEADRARMAAAEAKRQRRAQRKAATP